MASFQFTKIMMMATRERGFLRRIGQQAACIKNTTTRSLSSLPQFNHWDNLAFEEDEISSAAIAFPNSVENRNIPFYAEKTGEKTTITFQTFVERLPAAIHMRQELTKNPQAFRLQGDPVTKLFRSVDFQKQDWEPFAYFDPTLGYTRNLVATDDETFTLLLLCWNPGRESRIHDHQCDGCWLQVLHGQVQEVRYEFPKSGECEVEKLHCVSDEVLTEGDVTYISDSLGLLHKVGNPSKTLPSASLHLYSPPFQHCKVWADDDRPYLPQNSVVTHYSEYGQKV